SSSVSRGWRLPAGLPSLSPFPPYHNTHRPARQALPALVHKGAGLTKDRLEHVPREPASKGILLARMIGAQQGDTRQRAKLAVPETGNWGRHHHAQLASGAEVGSKGDLPQSDHHADSGQGGQFLQQIRTAGAKLLGQRLVVGRSTVDGRGDVTIVQPQA